MGQRKVLAVHDFSVLSAEGFQRTLQSSMPHLTKCFVYIQEDNSHPLFAALWGFVDLVNKKK